MFFRRKKSRAERSEKQPEQPEIKREKLFCVLCGAELNDASLQKCSKVCEECDAKARKASEFILERYYKMLTDHLERSGIKVDETEKADSDRVRFGLLVYDRSTQKHIVEIPEDREFGQTVQNTLERAEYHGIIHVLAAAAAGSEVYMLRGTGEGISSDETAEGAQLFDKCELCMDIITRMLPEKLLKEAVEEYRSPGIHKLGFSRYYYDAGEKAFFSHKVSGNYYHGYEVWNETVTKEELLRKHIAEDPYEAETMCLRGKVPMIYIIMILEESGKNYSVPEDFGFGSTWI